MYAGVIRRASTMFNDQVHDGILAESGSRLEATQQSTTANTIHCLGYVATLPLISDTDTADL